MQNSKMKSTYETLIKALRVLASDIHSEDGVANLALHEAADRFEELVNELKKHREAPTADQFEELEKCVIEWAKARQIIPNATAVSQLLKAVSEMGELADAVAKGQCAEMMDAVGDVLVCLINLCALEGTSLAECLGLAYDQIKDRKGRLLPNGIFVKEVME